MVNHSYLKVKQRPMCQRCGGQLIRSQDDISCLQCGALHTEEGKLAIRFPKSNYKPPTTLRKAQRGKRQQPFLVPEVTVPKRWVII